MCYELARLAPGVYLVIASPAPHHMYKVFQVLMTGYEARRGGILFKRDSRPTHVRAGNGRMNMQKGHFMPVPPHFDSGKKSFAARTAFGCLRCKLGIRCVHELKFPQT